MFDILFQHLPFDIVQKIQIFVTCPIAEIVRTSRYYGRPFPFLYCHRNVTKECTLDVQTDYEKIIKEIVAHRRLQSNFREWKYRMFHVYANDGTEEYFNGTDNLYFVGMPRFKNEMGLLEVSINLFPVFEHVATNNNVEN